MLTSDGHYGPWAECCAPGPYVILHYSEGGYQLASDSMRKPAPSTEDLVTRAEQLHSCWGGYPYSSEVFWEATLDLIYTGHAELVEPFLEIACPDQAAAVDRLLGSIEDGLKRSLYWPEIKALSTEWPWPEE